MDPLDSGGLLAAGGAPSAERVATFRWGSPGTLSSLSVAGPVELFAERARSLEPRALGCGALAGSTPPNGFFLSCEQAALADCSCDLLTGLSRRPSARDGRRIEIWGSLPLLETLAEEDETAALLLQTVQSAHRPPAPPWLMGILNVTPDSFSDGGSFLAPDKAIEQGLKLVEEGAEMLDVGGESTRPGSTPVSPETELDRTLPVIEGLRSRTRIPISIDTTRASVARAALGAGATIVNDISAGRFDEEMLSVVAEHDAHIVLMHMQNTPQNMQVRPRYGDVVTQVSAHLRDRVSACLKAGIALTRIAVDPGIGFGKRLKDNLELVRSIPELRSLGLPIVLGVSRKSFLGAITRRAPAREAPARSRDAETLAAIALGCAGGADIHRVHDVGPARRALEVAAAIRSGGAKEHGHLDGGRGA